MSGLSAKQARFVDRNKINVDRFWTMVDVRSENECWPFLGAKDDKGYGRFHVGRSKNACMLAHRISFGLCTGEEPEAVCHRCDNPPCCNPGHLFGGTRDDNNKDMARKGRNRVPRYAARGEKHHSAKISNDAATIIRSVYADGGTTQRKLAKEYGVSQRTITKIVRNESFVNA
jgi:hypothetical protein